MKFYFNLNGWNFIWTKHRYQSYFRNSNPQNKKKNLNKNINWYFCQFQVQNLSAISSANASFAHNSSISPNVSGFTHHPSFSPGSSFSPSMQTSFDASGLRSRRSMSNSFKSSPGMATFLCVICFSDWLKFWIVKVDKYSSWRGTKVTICVCFSLDQIMAIED